MRADAVHALRAALVRGAVRRVLVGHDQGGLVSAEADDALFWGCVLGIALAAAALVAQLVYPAAAWWAGDPKPVREEQRRRSLQRAW